MTTLGEMASAVGTRSPFGPIVYRACCCETCALHWTQQFQRYLRMAVN